jgi:hypothetical protein
MTCNAKLWARALSGLALFFLVPHVGHSQVASRISGTVSDATGAAIPGVRVVVTDLDRGTTQTTSTNEVGRYAFPNLGAGKYRVSAEVAGFKKAFTETINVYVNQPVDVDIRMELGALAEQVEVIAAATLLQTSDTQVGGLVENKQIQDLPLAARDFMQLTLLAPGAVESTGNLRHQTERGTWLGSFSVHGNSSKYNQYLFDGMSGKEMQHETNIFAPSVDAIQEIKVETSNYDAEFGGEAGGHINVVIKSGTNQLHGALFEFLRNDLANAKEKFADRKSELRRNTFGATIGGPIRKDKTFLFGSWESMRLRQGFTQNTTVPTAAMRNGDFSPLLQTDFTNTRPVPIYDWTTGQPFSGNLIPTSRLNGFTTKFIERFIPLSIRAGSGGIIPINNYQSLAPQETRTDQVILRADHTFSSATRLFGHYIIGDTATLGPPVWPAFSYTHDLRGQHPVAGVSHTISPTAIFDFRAGYSRFYQPEWTQSAFKENTARILGLKGACDLPECWHAPYFSVTNFSTLGNPGGATQGQGVSGPRTWKNEIFQIHSSLYLTRGKHTFRVGFTGNRYRDTFVETYYPAGQHSFNGQWTAGAGSAGFAFADVMLGLPRQIIAELDVYDPDSRNNHVMPWAQDSWKITPKLTLNMGLRYEWMGKPLAKRRNLSNFYQTGPTTAAIITPLDTGLSGYSKKPDSLTDALMMNDNNNFAPRVGLAYQVSQNMVIRGAYGIFYQRDSANTWGLLSNNPPVVRKGNVTLPVSMQAFRDFPVDDLTPVVGYSAAGSKPAVYALSVDWHEAYVQQWNIFLERTVSKDMVVKVGYVGNHAVGLPHSYPPNEPAPGTGDVQSRRPFQNLGSVSLTHTSGQSTYNGLELQAQKRYSMGLSFLTSYTWSRTIDNIRLFDMWYGSSRKQLSDLNVSHRFSVSGVYEIPYGRGRKFGSSAPSPVDAVLGGWQLSTIAVLRSGFPFTVTTSGNIANTGGITQVPNRISNPNLSGSQQREARFFDTNAFVNPAVYTLGNAGGNPLVGPGFRNVDLSASKIFRIRERFTVQFRGEFFNILNHPNQGQPGATLGTANFGRITSTTGDPRTLQFGLKLLY